MIPLRIRTEQREKYPIHKTSYDWSCGDYMGAVKSRIGSFRMSYGVKPGIYALGRPDENSDVFATSNYKLTFDILRRSLKGINAWILALDTKNINVWCAAGKGTFGTDELINRINKTRLHEIINHRRLIVPQLGAVGISAAKIFKQTGFKVYFGPVEAKDIPEYIKAGYKKTANMRLIKFPILDRLILTPLEIRPAMKYFPAYAVIIMLIFGFQSSGIIFKKAWEGGLPFLILGLGSVFSGGLLTPMLLPFIPFRSFALKGLITGVVANALLLKLISTPYYINALPQIAAYVLFPAISSYIAVQFTGATTFTSMSGVKKELKIGIPFYISGAAISALMLLLYKLFELEVL